MAVKTKYVRLPGFPNNNNRAQPEGKVCELAGFRGRFDTTDHIPSTANLIEVLREHKLLLCLTFFDVKKASHSIQTEALIEALLT